MINHARLTSVLAATAIASLLLAPTPVHSQAWPTRPVTLIIPFAAGGPTDIVGRTLAVALGKALGQGVVIENRVGAGGTVAAAYVAHAVADGYIFFLHHNGMASATALYRKLPFDPLTDFEYVGQVADVPMTLIARKDFPPSDMKELIPYLQKNSDKINLANAGLGAVSHLCGMLLQQAIGANFTTIPFSGTAPAMNALLGGQVDLMCDQTTQTIPQIKSGAVKFYGVTTRNRIKALPDAPTLSEQGLNDFQMVVWHGIYAPKGTPKEIMQKMNAALRSALKDADVVARLGELGVEVVPESKQTPEGLQSWLKLEIERMGPLIRAAGTFAD